MTTEAFTNDPKIQKMTGDYQVDTKELSTILEKEDNVKNILDVLKTKESDVRSIRGLETAVLGNLNKLANKNNISELNISERGLLKLYMGLYRYEKNIDVANEQELLDKFVLSQKVKVNQLPEGVHLSNEISVDATGIYTMHIGKAKNELFDEGVNGYNTKIQFKKDEKGVRSLYNKTDNDTYTLSELGKDGKSATDKRIIALPSNDKNKSPLNYYTLSNDAKNPFEVSLVAYTKSIPIKADNLNTGEFEKTIISERTTVGGKEAFFSMVLKSNDKTTNSSSEYDTKEKNQKIYFDKEGKLIPNQTLFLKQKGKSIFMTYLPEQALDGSISFKIDEKQARSEYKDLKKTAVNFTTQVKEAGDKDVYDNELRQVKEGFKDNKLEVEKKIDVSGIILGKVLNVNQDKLQIGAIVGGKFVDDLTVPFSEFVSKTKDEKGNESEKKKDLIVICVDQKLYNIRRKSDTKYEISDFKDPNIDRISKMITNSFNDTYRNGLAQTIHIAPNLIAVGPSEDIISQKDGSDMIQYILKLQSKDAIKSVAEVVFDNKGRLISSGEKTDEPKQKISIVSNGERLFYELSQKKNEPKVNVINDNDGIQNYLQHLTFDGLSKDFSQIQELPKVDEDGFYTINGVHFNKLLEPEPSTQTIDGTVYTIQGSNGKYKVEKTTEQQKKDVESAEKNNVKKTLEQQLPSGWAMVENTQGYWMKSTDGISGIQVDKSGALNGLTEVKKWDTKTNTFVIDTENKAVLDNAGKLQITKKVDAEKIFNTVNESKERIAKANNIVLPTGWEKMISSTEDGKVSVKLYSPEDLQKYFADKAGLSDKIKQLDDYTLKAKQYADYSATEKDQNNANSERGSAYEEFKTTQLKDHGEFNDNDKKLRQDKCAAKKRELLGTMTDADVKKLQNDIDTAIVAYRKVNPTELPPKTSLELSLMKTEKLVGSGKSAKKSVGEDIVYDSKNTHKLSFEYSTDKKTIVTKQNNQEVGKGIPVSNQDVKKPTSSPIKLDKTPEIVNNNGKETIVNTPTIKPSTDAKDITPIWKKDTDGNFVNPIKTNDGKEIQVIVDKNNGTITTDKPNEYTVQQNADNTISVTKKPTENSPANQNNTPPTSTEKKANASESKEIKDRNFNWYGWKSQPTSLNFKYGANDTESFTTQFNIKQANIDNRKTEFKNLLSELMSSNLSNKPAIIATDDENTAIGKLQDWLISKEACDCVFNTSDPKKAGLDDELLGLNTYVALKYTVQKLLHPTELTKEWLEKSFTIKDVVSPITVKKESKKEVGDKYDLKSNYPTLKKIIKSNLDKNGNGSATLLFKNGAKYEGDFKNGVRKGKGVHTGPDGSRYEGDFQNDKAEGKGVYTESDGTKYVGDFKNDEYEGKGVITRPDGSKYEGDFKNDEYEGKGVYTTVKGKKFSGTFKDNILIKDSKGKPGKWTLEQLDKY